mgnify:FL=1
MNEKLYRLMNWPEIEAIIYSEENRKKFENTSKSS